MRAVVDTNILVRAMLKPTGSVGPVVDFLRDGLYVLLYSDIPMLPPGKFLRMLRESSSES